MTVGLRRAFTLIELILVMAVLATVLAIAAPRLSGFMWGRSLQEQGRRLLALNRYGRSVAVSESTPMQLWVEPLAGAYGLAPQSGYAIEGEKELTYRLPEGLQLEVSQDALDEKGRGYVSFWPDGTIDELSLTRLVVRGRDREALALVQRDLIAGYEVVNVRNQDTREEIDADTKRKDTRGTSSRTRQ